MLRRGSVDFRLALRALCALVVCVTAASTAAAALDSVVEAKNYSKTLERQRIYNAPAYHRSRLEFTRSDGTKVDCEDLRAGCAALSGDDGYPGDYSYATIDRSPDR